jgi:hypothetical protein
MPRDLDEKGGLLSDVLVFWEVPLNSLFDYVAYDIEC